MAVEETLKLRVETENEKKLADLQAQLKALIAEEKELQDAYERGSVRSEVYREALTRLTREKQRAESAAQSLGKTIERDSSAWTKYQQNITAAGYAVNDFFSVTGGLDQRLNAIANNLPLLFAGFGGLGLALSGIVPIVAALILNWDHLKEAITGTVDISKTKLDELQERIKELEDKPHKIAVDVLELENARKEVDKIRDALAAVDRLKKLTGGLEKESGKAIEEQFAEAPGGGAAIRDIIRKQAVMRLAEASEPLAAARKEEEKQAALIASIREDLRKPQTDEERQALSARLAVAEKERDAAVEKVRMIYSGISREGGEADVATGKMMSAAISGTGAKQKQAQQQLAWILDFAGQRDLAAAVRQSSPEALQQQYETEQGFEESLTQRKAQSAREKKLRQEQREAGESIQAGMDAVNREIEQADIEKNARQFDEDIARKEREAQANVAAQRRQKQSDASVKAWQERTAKEAQQLGELGPMGQDQAVAVAQRMRELQTQGMQADQARNQAFAEMMAWMTNQGQYYMMLRQQAEFAVMQIRALNRAQMRANAETQQMAGQGPG